MLAPRVLELLVAQHDQRAADALARFVRLDHVVDETAAAGDEGVGEALFVFSLARGEFLRCEVNGDEITLTRKGILQADTLLPEYFEEQHREVRYT